MDSDTEILKRIKNNDREAFVYFYDKYAPILYGVITKLTPDLVVANYVLAKTFKKIICHAVLDNDSESKFKNQMLGIAVKECMKVTDVSALSLVVAFGRSGVTAKKITLRKESNE